MGSVGFKGIVWVLIAAWTTSCITTYRDFPENALNPPDLPRHPGVLHYQIKKFPVLEAGGSHALQESFAKSPFFAETVSVDAAPAKGLYVLVDVEYKPLSLPALIFGYLSVSMLTFLPVYSGRDGYRVHYHLHDGADRLKTYSYEVTRKFALWLGLLPFIWVNAATYSEEEAFTATVHQFFIDAQADRVFTRR